MEYILTILAIGAAFGFLVGTLAVVFLYEVHFAQHPCTCIDYYPDLQPPSPDLVYETPPPPGN